MASVLVKRSQNGANIVFIHGINSNVTSCWTNGSTYWPKDVAHDIESDQGLSQFGVYAFDYPATLNAGTFALGDVVNLLKAELHEEGIASGSKIVFVCHSMGGIVARRYIVTEQQYFGERGTRIGLFLLASPTLGSHYANLAAFLGVKSAQIEALKASQMNVWLNDLHTDFRNLKESGRLRLVGKELVEDKALFLKSFLKEMQIVPPSSAAQYFSDPIKIPYSDHCSISAPLNKDALQYRLLKSFLRDNFVTEWTIEDLLAHPATVYEPTATAYLNESDNGDVQRIWDLTDPTAQRDLLGSLANIQEIYNQARKPRGQVVSRVRVGTDVALNLPGRPEGVYRSITYVTKFSNDAGKRAETLLLRATPSQFWQAYGYQISAGTFGD